MPEQGMTRFWDRRADEDAFYFVDNRRPYGSDADERFWSDGERDLDELLRRLGAELRGSDEVVEIGCGVGRLTRALARRAAHVTALDVSPRMLDLARRHNGDLPNVRWVVGDGRSLSGIPEASADACVSHVVFQHIPDPAITLGYVAEMGRVLRPGGWAAFQVSNAPELHYRRSRRERLRAAARAALRGAPGGQAHPAWIGSAVALGDLRASAQAAGMDVQRIAGEGTQSCLVLAVRSGA